MMLVGGPFLHQPEPPWEVLMTPFGYLRQSSSKWGHRNSGLPGSRLARIVFFFPKAASKSKPWDKAGAMEAGKIYTSAPHEAAAIATRKTRPGRLRLPVLPPIA